jgi:hypothetical protein
MADKDVLKTGTGNWGSLGGNNKMHGFEPTGTQTPDRTSQEGHSGSRRDIAPQAGPSGVMGYSKNEAKNSFGAGPQEPGQSSQSGARQEGFAHGGNTKMFGNRGSRPARPGCTGPDGG